MNLPPGSYTIEIVATSTPDEHGQVMLTYKIITPKEYAGTYITERLNEDDPRVIAAEARLGTQR